MYKICENIRVRNCGQLSFLIDITNNNIFSLKTNTLEYLKCRLEEGSIEENNSEENQQFLNFLIELRKNNILEVDSDEC